MKIISSPGSVHFPAAQTNNPMFNYTDSNPQMMEMALRFLSKQQTGDPGKWTSVANDLATRFMQTHISMAGIQSPNYGNGNMMDGNMQ